MPFERELAEQLRQSAAGIHPPAELDQSIRDGYMRYTMRSRSRLALILKMSTWTVTATVLITGGTLAAGFASPAIAHVLQKLPLIAGVADALYAEVSPGVQKALQSGFNIPIDQAITRHGVTLTITNAYFGPEQLWIGVTESFPKGTGNHRAVPFGRVSIRLNGRTPAVFGTEFKPLAKGGYAGTISVGNMVSDPSQKLTAAVSIHLAGDVGGAWNFQFPLSRVSTISATRTWNPRVSQSFEGSTWSIDKVEVTPASILLWGNITIPGHVPPSLGIIRVYAKEGAWPNAPVNQLTFLRRTKRTSTWQYAMSVDRVAPLPKALSLVPVLYSPDYTLPVPGMSSQISTAYTFFPGTDQQMTITHISRSVAAIKVYYSTVGSQYKKYNAYELAIFNGGETRSTARIAYPTGFHIVNSARHEAVLVFPGLTNWRHASIRYYPPGLPSDPFVNRHGVVGMEVPAPKLTLHVFLR